MIFDKVSRQRIYAAKGKALDVLWPAESEPRVGGKYSIQSSSKAGEYQLRVLSFRRLPDRVMATVKLEGDPVRLLAITTGYTEFTGRAMSEEPEAVTAEDQRRMTLEARLTHVERERVQHGEDAARHQARRVNVRLRDVMVRAARLGEDATPMIAKIEREIRAQEQSFGAVPSFRPTVVVEGTAHPSPSSLSRDEPTRGSRNGPG